MVNQIKYQNNNNDINSNKINDNNLNNRKNIINEENTINGKPKYETPTYKEDDNNNPNIKNKTFLNTYKFSEGVRSIDDYLSHRNSGIKREEFEEQNLFKELFLSFKLFSVCLSFFFIIRNCIRQMKFIIIFIIIII